MRLDNGSWRIYVDRYTNGGHLDRDQLRPQQLDRPERRRLLRLPARHRDREVGSADETQNAAGAAAAAGALLRPGAALAATYSGYVMAYFTESPKMAGGELRPAPGGQHRRAELDPAEPEQPGGHPDRRHAGPARPVHPAQAGRHLRGAGHRPQRHRLSYQSQYLHVWDSTDLRTFTGYRLLKMHTLATHAWAPEAFWDAARGQYGIVYSAVNNGHNVFMVNYTTDFVTASAPQVFFDPGLRRASTATSSGRRRQLPVLQEPRQQHAAAAPGPATLNPGSFTIYTSALGPGRGIEAPQLVKSQHRATSGTCGATRAARNGRSSAGRPANIAAARGPLLNDRAYTQPLNSKHARSARSPPPSTSA